MMDTSVIYMNQLPVSERRGESCGTSLHGSTVGYKPDPCDSVSLGLCSSNLGMYSTMDTTEVNESFVTPKRQSNSQFRQMISQQVGQLLFNSPLSVCCGQLQNDTSVEEKTEHKVTKRVTRRHHSMRENKRKHCRTSHSTHEHCIGNFQPETQETYSREYLSALSQEHIYEEIPDISDERTRFVHPHYENICKNLGERSPCDGQEISPVQQRRQRTSSVQSRCTVRRVNRSMSMKEGRTRKDKKLYLEHDAITCNDKSNSIQGQRPTVEGQRSTSTRKMLQRRLKKFSNKLSKFSSIKTLAFL